MTQCIVKSEALLKRAQRRVWKGGSAATRNALLQRCGFPAFLEEGNGCEVRDVDGNRYVDYLMSWGSVLLGHGFVAVERAAAAQMARGTLLGFPPALEVTLSERLVELIPGLDQVRFLSSGSEATTAAVRIARAATGRRKVVRYGYHGWLDWCLGSHPAGIPSHTLADTLTWNYNDLDNLRAIFDANRDDIACVILEPVKGELPHTGLLEHLREFTHSRGALLVFDEVKTGFRLGLGGAQARYGVLPDISVFSKALANGFPLAAVGGRDEVLAAASDVWITGTYHGWPAALAAADATLTVLETEPVIEHVHALGARLKDGFDAIMAEHDLPLRLGGPDPMPQINCAEADLPTLEAVIRGMVSRGYLVHPLRPWFLSYSHTDAHIQRTLGDLSTVASEVGLSVRR